MVWYGLGNGNGMAWNGKGMVWARVTSYPFFALAPQAHFDGFSNRQLIELKLRRETYFNQGPECIHVYSI